MKLLSRHLLVSLCLLLTVPAFAGKTAFSVVDQGYLSSQGLDVLVFSNAYNGPFGDAKISAVEIIHHGMRTGTNGDLRLQVTPEQWDEIPVVVDRKVDQKKGVIEAHMRYEAHDFDYTIRVTAKGEDFLLAVDLPKALPKALEGKAGLIFEFLPAAYFGKAFLMDGKPGLLPHYPAGPKELNTKVLPKSLAKGERLVLAPADEERRIEIRSEKGELQLYDGRSKAQNGWLVVRSELPAGKKGEVMRWRMGAGRIHNWLRTPVIGHSQVGYHPQQKKVAVVELDMNDRRKPEIELLKISENGRSKVVSKGAGDDWGTYKRYRYRTFDFTAIDKPGVYVLQYGDVRTEPFVIDADVYKQAWHPTLDVYLPVQMDHVLVNEAYRVWHGASHLDDALQAPVNHEHFDMYAQGPTTDTEYQPGEHIPGLNIGGWYDAGDYDIRTQTQYRTVNQLVDVWETFKPERDTTLVDYDRKYVDLHVADGKPDLLQQIEHGTLGLIAQHRALGRAISGIIVPTLEQYTHLGDGLTMTDNLIYNKALGELESNGFESGKFDDRWAFTSRSSALNYGSIAALAGASRALKGYNDELAKECLETAIRAWDEEQSHEPYIFKVGNTTGGPLESEIFKAAVELLITTGDKRYAKQVSESLDYLQGAFGWHVALAVRAMPHMDKAYRDKIRGFAEDYKNKFDDFAKANPYGVNITEGGWAGNGVILAMAVNNYYLHKAFPDLVSEESVYSALNYLYGTHPHSDVSFVSGVGAKTKKVAYGMNRADYSYIPGGIVPGVLIIKPDFPENKENWPFFWGENEYVVNLAGSYIFLVHAVDALLNEK